MLKYWFSSSQKVYRIFRLCISSFSFTVILLPGFAAADAGAPAQEPRWTNIDLKRKTEFIDQNIDKIAVACRGKFNIVINVTGENILCLHGSIRETDKDNITGFSGTDIMPNSEMTFRTAYVRSSGGDAEAAIKIGKRINQNRALLIVDKHCHSSCGNYLIPSAYRLYMTDDTVISMHGSLPRSFSDFLGVRVRARMRKLSAEGLTPPSRREMAREFSDKYTEYVDTTLMSEIKFFANLAKDEAYVTRFKEVKRMLNYRPNYHCAPDKGLYIIVGTNYLKEFNIKTVREWFPEDKSDYVDLLPRSRENYSFVFDFDEHPFWLSGKGLVSPVQCVGEADIPSP